MNNKNGMMPYEVTPYENIRDVLKPKNVQITGIVLDKTSQVKNIRVDNVEMKDVKAMFD